MIYIFVEDIIYILHHYLYAVVGVAEDSVNAVRQCGKLKMLIQTYTKNTNFTISFLSVKTPTTIP